MNSLIIIDIPKRSTHCFAHGERLAPGMEIYSLVYEDKSKKGMVRHDFCSICWNPELKKGEKFEFKTHWKSKIENKKLPLSSSRVERGLALLRHLIQQPEVDHEEIFILCLFLSHARQLTLRQEFQREGITYQLYEISRQEEFLTVKKVFNLSGHQITNMQASIAKKLSYQ